MKLLFNEEDHTYHSIDDIGIKWTSVTSVISKLKKPFDAKKVANKVSKNKKSKWYNLKPTEIIEIWNKESKRATDLGTFYHNQRESDICSLSSMEKEGLVIPVVAPQPLKNGKKLSSTQKLDPGIYPEHMVYLKSASICGQADLVEVVNNKVHIIDYKTNKEIKKESYKNWEGISDKMAPPVSNLDDCNFSHYSLQLSIYMYIVLKHNPKLRPGNIFIYHVEFEKEGEDKYGYPITKKTDSGDPVVKKVNILPIKYLVDEVHAILHYLKNL
jgi:ATP-dependent exoDNAse (exonuclease V) beta subunit